MNNENLRAIVVFSDGETYEPADQCSIMWLTDEQLEALASGTKAKYLIDEDVAKSPLIDEIEKSPIVVTRPIVGMSAAQWLTVIAVIMTLATMLATGGF